MYPAAANFDIRIENTEGGNVSIYYPETKQEKIIGHVIKPVRKTGKKGFTASGWIEKNRIAAVSVNAIHVKLSGERELISILPKEFIKSVKNYNSYLSYPSAIIISLSAGEGILGGDFSPVVGNEVFINGKEIPADYNPKIGDRIAIQVVRSKELIEIIFENKFNGRIIEITNDGEERIVGKVLKPVLGIGRFAGSKFVPPGRIRANHPGVIEVSTSNVGYLGGFQIIPAVHGESKEMILAKIKTQWMVVSPIDEDSFAGKSPLFYGFIYPRYNKENLEEKQWDKKLLQNFLAEVKKTKKDRWEAMPIFDIKPRAGLPKDADKFLRDVVEIRILFPIE